MFLHIKAIVFIPIDDVIDLDRKYMWKKVKIPPFTTIMHLRLHIKPAGKHFL